MTHPAVPRWLEWARQIQALSQTGYHYAENEYQRERYKRLTEIAAEIASESAGLEYTPLLDVFRAQIGYATPRVDVRAAVFQQGKLLLVRERQDNGWTMPGGWADVGDVPSEAAEREALTWMPEVVVDVAPAASPVSVTAPPPDVPEPPVAAEPEPVASPTAYPTLATTPEIGARSVAPSSAV
jgi:hypothetical protein